MLSKEEVREMARENFRASIEAAQDDLCGSPTRILVRMVATCHEQEMLALQAGKRVVAGRWRALRERLRTEAVLAVQGHYDIQAKEETT